ncbi:MAG: DNA polymerase III subunit alpha, partial [Oscillospiraceae bacterium]|nr:DNA polymerase III subunit alpha [Oscillospiraceae bacterium]
KCHYPREYMAALMTSVLDSATKISGYIAECKELKIPVLPPDINRSDDPFTVEGDAIRFGLGAVKNVGHGLIRGIVSKREEGGPFRSLEDLLQRMGEGELNKRAVENFIKCGAMDCFGHHRSELLAVFDQMMDSVASTRKRNLDGQMGLFTMLEDTDAAVSLPIPKMPERPKAELMAMEKETTGIYISGHPMDDYRRYLKGTHVIGIGQLMNDEEGRYQDEQIVSVAGIVQGVKMKTTRNNSVMAYVTVEDDTAAIEMLAFSNVLGQYGGYLREGEPVVITGRLSLRDEKEPQVIVNRARPITDLARQPEREERPAPQVVQAQTLYLKLDGENDPRFRKVRAIVNMFPGDGVVKVFFADTRKVRGARAAFDQRMLRELEDVLGRDNVVLK